MPKVTIDNKTYDIRPGLNMLQVALELRIDLPYFCWHPAMGSVGACRQCAVMQYKDENDTKGRLVMACMTPAVEGTRISVITPEAADFRASVTEWLMINHPHDCPVCDEGGECHLQDMTYLTGHDYRRYRGTKRTFRNQNLGPFVTHEMNRCIQCYRCVRYYRDYAGGKDFNSFLLHDTVYFGRAADGTLESEFSGNLVDVCPTGVFTDKTLNQHYTRKWDLQTAPSICVNCSLGCNTIPGERYGSLRRITNRYNGDVNGYFLCDRGRYGYEFVNSEARIRQVRVNGQEQPIQADELRTKLKEVLADGKRVIGIGSPRASLESNFALRALVGTSNYYQGVPERDAALVNQVIHILQAGPARSASQQDVARADAVFVLGEDINNTAPMLALQLRQAARQAPLQASQANKIPSWDDYSSREFIQSSKSPIFIGSISPTRSDDLATAIFRGTPQNLARLGFAVAHELDPAAPNPDDLPDEQSQYAKAVAEALRSAKHPVVISGTSLGSADVIQAAANVAWALSKPDNPAGLCYALPEVNSMGLGLMGGESLDQALQVIEANPGCTAIILENDLTRRISRKKADKLFTSACRLIVLDSLDTPTTRQAEIFLPAGTFAESSGTFVNNEGRAQRFYQVFEPAGSVLESWRWVREMLAVLSRSEAEDWQNLDGVQAALASQLSQFHSVLEIAPPASYRLAGQKIPRQPTRYSGRTAMHANVTVHEPMPPRDPDTPLSFSMEGAQLQPPAALIPRFWAPGWNSNNSLTKYQAEINGPLEGGNPGCRLIEPHPAAGKDYFKQIPPNYERKTGEWLILPLYHIYGSEELSMLSRGVASQAPQPYLGLNRETFNELAQAAGMNDLEPGEKPADGITAALSIAEEDWQIPVRLVPGLTQGCVGLPIGLAGWQAPSLPALGKVSLIAVDRKAQD